MAHGESNHSSAAPKFTLVRASALVCVVNELVL